MFISLRSSGLVTSTFQESELFANAGFDDILYAYPLIEAHMERNSRLADKLEDYHLMVANREGLDALLKHDPPRGKKWQVRKDREDNIWLTFTMFLSL